MTKTTTNRDIGHAQGLALGPDGCGQAAMLLVESVIHGLVSRSLISVEDAIEIVEIAAEAEEELASKSPESIETPRKSAGLLEAVLRSLKTELAVE